MYVLDIITNIHVYKVYVSFKSHFKVYSIHALLEMGTAEYILTCCLMFNPSLSMFRTHCWLPERKADATSSCSLVTLTAQVEQLFDLKLCCIRMLAWYCLLLDVGSWVTYYR